MKSDATRYLRGGVLTMAFDGDGGPVVSRVRQRPDGSLAVRLEGRRPASALEKLRFVLAADDDHRPFLERFRDDPVLGGPIRDLAGLRPLRVATVSHALLKAVCGQLIQSRAARLLERRLLRVAAPVHDDLRLPPDRSTFAGYAPAELVRYGLAARKAGVLVRLSREWDLERLRSASTGAAAGFFRRAQDTSRRGAGSMPARSSSSHTVLGATVNPSRTSSPWMRRWPHVGFSAAIRRINCRSCGGIDGRPGGRWGFVQ